VALVVVALVVVVLVVVALVVVVPLLVEDAGSGVDIMLVLTAGNVNGVLVSSKTSIVISGKGGAVSSLLMDTC